MNPSPRECAASVSKLEPSHQLLLFLGEELRTIDLPASGVVTIGRGSANAIRIEHALVSRTHALLHLGPPLQIEDLGGQNGTTVVDRAPQLAAGDTQGVRRLVGQIAEVQVGDPITFGAVTVIIRRRDDDAFGLPEPTYSADTKGPVVLDPGMRALYEEAFQAARAPISVLILGETGVGKEVLAQAIHARSPRSGGPFLAINCAALSESTIDSELFGHERGAFTGAGQARPGLFQSANGGSVFLDEVGELPLLTQAKLLRVLEERSVLPIGARAARPVDVRFIAATNRDLEALVRQGRFRQDLFFRINAVTLTVPALRERPSELETLARAFVLRACHQLDQARVPALSANVVQVFRSYTWPGNVRELRNAVERAVALCRGATIEVMHLPRSLKELGRSGTPQPEILGEHSAEQGHLRSLEPVHDESRERLQSQLESLERARIVGALNASGGNQTLAAKSLGMARRTLIARMEKFDLPRPRKSPT